MEIGGDEIQTLSMDHHGLVAVMKYAKRGKPKAGEDNEMDFSSYGRDANVWSNSKKFRVVFIHVCNVFLYFSYRRCENERLI